MSTTTQNLADALRALMEFAEFGDIAGKRRSIHDVKVDARSALAAYDAQQAPAAPSPDVEAQARELLAAEMDKAGMGKTAEHCRAGTLVAGHMPAIRAITAALRQQPVQPVQAAPMRDALVRIAMGDEPAQMIADAALAATRVVAVQAAPGAVAWINRDNLDELQRGGPRQPVFGKQHLDVGVPLYAAPHATPLQAAPGAVGEVSDEFTNIAGERWHEVRWFAKPKVGTKLYAAPNPQPVDDTYLLREMRLAVELSKSSGSRDIATAYVVRWIAAIEAAHLRPQPVEDWRVNTFMSVFNCEAEDTSGSRLFENDAPNVRAALEAALRPQ